MKVLPFIFQEYFQKHPTTFRHEKEHFSHIWLNINGNTYQYLNLFWSCLITSERIKGINYS